MTSRGAGAAGPGPAWRLIRFERTDIGPAMLALFGAGYVALSTDGVWLPGGIPYRVGWIIIGGVVAAGLALRRRRLGIPELSVSIALAAMITST